MKTFAFKTICCVAGLFLATNLNLFGDTELYWNSATDTGYDLGVTNGQQVGNQITLGGSEGVSYTLDFFSFEYYTPDETFSGNVQAEVNFYLNTGAPFEGYATPAGSPFFSTGWFNVETANQIDDQDVATYNFDQAVLNSEGLTGTLPNNFTFTVTFTGLGAGDQIGLELFDPPSAGQNTGDYWVNNNGNSWVLETNSMPVAFGAEFGGTPTPEPTPLWIGVMGVALLMLARRSKVSSVPASK